MKNLYLSFILFLLIPIVCFAQVDSLQLSLKKLTQQEKSFVNDTSQISLLNEIAWQFRNLNADSSVFYAQKALQYAKKIKWNAGIGLSYKRLGVAYRNKSNYPKTVESLLQALRVFEQMNDNLNIAGCYHNLGLVYQRRNNFKQALYYFELTLKIHLSSNNVRGLMNTYNNIGMTLYKQKKYPEALQYYQKNLALEHRLKDKFIQSITYRNIGEVHLGMGTQSEAKNFLQKALKISTEINNKIVITTTLNDLARIHLQNTDYEKAIELAQKSIEVGSSLGAREYIKDSYFILYQCFKRLKDDINTLKYFEIYITYRDSLFNEENSQTIAELQNDFEMEKKQKEIELINKDKKIHSLFSYSLAGVLLFIGVISMVLWHNNRQKHHSNQLLRQQKEEILVKNQTLHKQNNELIEINHENDSLVDIVAHDLRSPLNRVRGLVQLVGFENNLSEDQKSYLKLMDKSCESGLTLIRDLLDIHQIDPEDFSTYFEEINLTEFIPSFLDNYQAQLLFKDIQLHTDLPNAPVFFNTEITHLTRILDNLISNAIKFSYRESNIHISLQETDNQAIISIKDEGQGISKDEQAKLFKKFQKLSARPTAGEESSGLGLAIAKTLVDQLKGTIKVISEVNQGSEFIVNLPKKIA